MRVGVFNPGPDVMHTPGDGTKRYRRDYKSRPALLRDYKSRPALMRGPSPFAKGGLRGIYHKFAKSPGFCQINDGLAQPSRRFLEQSNRRRPLCDPQQEPSQQSKQ